MTDTRPPLSRRILATLIEIGQTRLQLAATEIEEERLRLARMSLSATVCLFFTGLGIAFAAGAVVLACPLPYRAWAAGACSLLFIGVGAGWWRRWQRDAAARPAWLAATLAELTKDRQFLEGCQE